MSNIKFGTDGWRAIIALDYTVENVLRVTTATAAWLKKASDSPSVVIGFDCRFGGPMFQEYATRCFGSLGVKVLAAEGFVSTPMISLGAVKLKADAGIVITASHNPPSYNGFKIKGSYGGPALPAMISEVEDLIPADANDDLPSIDDLRSAGLLEIVDLEQMYIDHVNSSFDIDLINNSGLTLAYDAMFGAGQNVIRRLLPNAMLHRCEHNPGFNGQAPEPIMKNLKDFSNLIKADKSISSGLATDGDADRIGLLDENGGFVDSHHIILMLIQYLHKHRGMNGAVACSFSCSGKIKKMCEEYGLEHIETKIGFKYIAGHILDNDILVGGEESGGIAVKGHIPERDGIWMGLLIWEYMAKTGKSLAELKQEVYDVVGPFAFERVDLRLDNELKLQIIEKCKAGSYASFGSYSISRTEDLDGFKYHLSDNSWLMIRPSGTEPVLRIYAEAPTQQEALDILDACQKQILEA